MQSLIDESVHALFAAVVEQIHKFAQVSAPKAVQFISASLHTTLESSESHAFLLLMMSFLLFSLSSFLPFYQPADANMLHILFILKYAT